MRLFCIVFFAAVAGGALARTPTRYLELVNRAPDTVTSLAAAPAGEKAFLDVPLVEPLHGGDATRVELAAGGCRYDVRVAFRGGRTVVYRGVDACRDGGLYIDRLPR